MLTWINWLTLTCLALLGSTGGHQQIITTKLVAPWTPTSILHEAAEYVADIHPSLYWQFLENLMDKFEHLPQPTTDEGERDLASVAAFNVISSSKLRMMDWALTSRAYSPKVLSLQQLAPDHIPSECMETFVVLGSIVTCNVQEVENWLLNTIIDKQPLITEDDHKYPSLIWTTNKEPPIAILFGQFYSTLTRKFHQLLKEANKDVGYIFRPSGRSAQGKSKSKGIPEKLLLAGYGVELQFKSQEYKAQDDSAQPNRTETREMGGFMFDKLQELHPDKAEELVKFQNYLATSRGSKAEFEALKAWQVQELGLQASHYATLQEDLLEALMDVSGNFPSRAAALSSIRVPSDFKRHLAFNQRLLSSHFNLDEGEGALFLQGSFIDPDSLDLFSFMDTLQGELEFMELIRSLRHERPVVKREEVNRILSLGTKTSAEPELALDIRDSSVFWINDLEKDEEYEDWPDDLTQLFFRMGGIMLRPVRRNVFNLVLTVDAKDTATSGGLLKLAQSFMAHKSPVRIGVVFCSEENSETDDTAKFVRRVMNYAASEGKTRQVFSDIVQGFLGNDFSKMEKRYEHLLGDEFDFGAELACDFVRRSGRGTPGAFLNGIPLKWDSLDDFEEVVLNQLLREAQSVQIEAYNGRVNEDTDIFDYLMNKPNVQTRLNDKILDTTNSKYVSFGTEIWELGKDIKDPLGKLSSSLSYLMPSGKLRNPTTVTIWVFADLQSKEGRIFLQTALEFLEESATHSRLAFISTSEWSSELISKVQENFQSGDIKTLQSLLAADWNDISTNQILNKEGAELMKLLGLRPGDRGVLVNGRLIGPLPQEETFHLGDWSLIQRFTYDGCPKYLEGEDWEADSVMRLCAALGSPTFRKNSKRFTLPEFQNGFAVGKRETEDPFHVDLLAVIDPASRYAHKMAALLTAVQQTVGQWVRIRILFNPPGKHSELPLKSYYRFVAGHKAEEIIVFEEIPRDPLFTQNIYAPDNWMVEVVKCQKDLDNIRLRDMGSDSVDSEYELEHLLVEGHCLEMKTGSPPRGLQFTLTPNNPRVKGAETIVMANLGYFQLKAEPGLWSLDLREGPSKDIFALESQNKKPVSVNSFQSIVIKVKVKRNAGKETASLLDSEEESSGWFGFGSKKTEPDEETINVFSVASGHLYERVLRIMMLSVVKNTKSKVKFWFLKNYLSPTLKDILPEMAKEYGLEYELVQYHWPRWLNPQREKQRIIWGYKILFLDVLFPLSLKKIVFVDADQVVRADLKELFDLDLEGNPYGYTPFCDSRTEMEGFRFWKTGYWKSHLGRRKYHISALYVVDLVRFRRIAAGDRLRGQYQALSQDPNSLSNLDQDLPNNMIHQVGIKSLPQEWLWCETWCDDASKKYAKTIDLCNNPQTKEPKLDAAVRIVPEWKDYDQEIRQFQLRLQQSKRAEEADREEDADLHDEL